MKHHCNRLAALLRAAVTVGTIAVLAGCTTGSPAPHLLLSPSQFAATDWQEVARRSRDSTVNFAMWSGDEERNRYLRGKVADELKRKHDIRLRITPLSDTADAVNKLLTERSGNKTGGGSIDMVWINGENFRTAKQGGLFWGPFAERLPNIGFFSAQARLRDFGTPVEGYEAPWSRAQFVMAYDSARVFDPPRSIEALGAWIKSHPGRFTYIAPPEFTGSVFIRHFLIHLGGGTNACWSTFNRDLYEKASAATMKLLTDLKPYLWRRGETYPATLNDQNRLFSNSEIDFAMSYGPNFASEHIARGEFPPTTRTFVFNEGTIGNYSFLAIPFNASNIAGALVVINFLMSPEQQLDRARALGDVFPLELSLLTPEERRQAQGLSTGPATLPAEVLAAHLIPEPDAEYLQRLEKDWLEKVLRQ
jgi:putative spermidine/putrescine transport system substrate-binding protein